MSMIGRSILNHPHRHRRSVSRIVALFSNQVERHEKLDKSRGQFLLNTCYYYSSTASCSPSSSSSNYSDNNRKPTVAGAGAMPLDDTHYQSHNAESYESAFFYQRGDYTTRLRDLVVQHLSLDDTDDEGIVVEQVIGVDTTPEGVDESTCTSRPKRQQQRRRLLDIGGGTGNFTRMLLEDRPHLEAIVIDPFLAKVEEESNGNDNDDVDCNRIIKEPSLRFVQASAEAFLNNNDDEWWKNNYHQVLFKEVVHHLHEEQRCDIFRAIHGGLLDIVPPTTKNSANNNSKNAVLLNSITPPPSLLIITRPQHEIDYPLWDAARQVWADNQPSSEQLAKELREAGYSHVDINIHVYPCILPSLTVWQDMIRNKCWSTFSHFSDTELELACQELTVTDQHRIDAQGRFHFEDRLVFLSAWK